MRYQSAYQQNAYEGVSAYRIDPDAGQAPSSLPVGLQHYWALGEASGSRSDSIGGLAFAQQGIVSSDVGVSGSAAIFTDSPTGHLEAVSDISLDISAITGATWSMWYRVSQDVIDGNQVATVICRGPAAGPASFSFFVQANATFQVIGGDGNFGDISTAFQSDVGQADEWTHALIWYDPDIKCANLEINGIAQTAGNALVGDPFNGVSALVVGTTIGSATYADFHVDEIAAWNRVLLPSERLELYNSGAGKFYPF